MLINGRDYAPAPGRGDTSRRGSRRGDLLEAPPPRDGIRPFSRPKLAQRFERAESSALTTAADTDSVLFRISGRPDTVVLSAQAAGAVFSLIDFLGREITEYHIPSGTSHETYLACDRIDVRNSVAGQNAVVMAVAKWASPYEAT